MDPITVSWNGEVAGKLPSGLRCVDLGGMAINGSVRGLYRAGWYVGVDLRPGRGVDVVADAATYQPPQPVDVVICNSLLEHTPNGEAICRNAYRMLKSDGLMVVTVPTGDYPAHDNDGWELGSEYYANVSEAELRAWLSDFDGVYVEQREKQLCAVASKGRGVGGDGLRILLVHPGASWSTADVWRGVGPALERQGARVVQYALDGRMQASGEYLMYAWKRGTKGRKEHGLDPLPKPTHSDMLYHAGASILERALHFDVDWVLIVSAMFIHPEVLALLRKAGVRTAILFTESPNDDETWQLPLAPLVDACWVNERTSVAKYLPEQPHTYYWQHAIDPEVHKPVAADDSDVAAHDVVFVGTGWQERCDLLGAVDWTGIDLGLYGSWELLGPRNHLRQYIRGGITPNAKTAALYRRAKIGINLHRTSVGWGKSVRHITHAESMNPRCYELAATGRFFITDRRAEVTEVFGDALPAFTTAAELESQIRYWLARDAERQARAAQLPGLMARHTFDVRAADMLQKLCDHS